MVNRLKIMSLLVNDYDEATQFYTQMLGFELVEDLAFGEGRWVTLSLPGNQSIAIALEHASEAEDRALVGKQAGSFPLMALDTSDCVGDYTRMKEAGVTFLGEPESGPWGTGVQLVDLYGNKIFLSQEP